MPLSLGRVANAASVTGNAAARQIAANTTNATRHPYEEMTALVMGDRITPPTFEIGDGENDELHAFAKSAVA